MASHGAERGSRSWAIRPWCFWVSIAMATATQMLFLATGVAQLVTGNRNPVSLVLIIGWPFFYGGVYGISHLIARIDQQGPVMNHFPHWYQSLFPPPTALLMNWWYRIAPNVALLLFPMFGVLLGTITFWSAATNQLNP